MRGCLQSTPSASLLPEAWSLSEASFINVRSPEILLPGTGPLNDPLRVRNIGKPLQPQGPWLESPGAPANAPASPALSSRSLCLAVQPEKPRTGILSSVDQVGIQYPDFNPQSLLGRTVPRPWREVANKPKLTLRPKEVQWNELPPPEVEELANLESSLSPKGRPSAALRKSAKMMEGLMNLRRMSTEAAEGRRGSADAGAEQRRASAESAQPGAVGQSPTPQPEDEDPLLRRTLKDLTDTEASLRDMISEVSTTQKLVDACGGNRHATQVLNTRALAVLRRKADLLHSVETRLAAYEAAHAQREQLLEGMTSRSIKEAPAELCGAYKFVSRHTHRPGDPVDADKSDFGAFAKTFLLPSKHAALERFRLVYKEASDWWAKATASAAREGADKEAIRALIALSVAAGAEEDHPYLVRADIVLKNRIADGVFKAAEEALAKDTAAAEKAELIDQIPPVGMAERAAAALVELISKAVKEGVQEKDSRMLDAHAIVKELRERDGHRKRLANRQKNLASQKAAQKS